MARAHYAENVVGTSGGGSLSLLSGATVHVYDQGTTDHIAQTIYDSDAGVGTLSNPLTSDANGKIEFWLNDPARVDLVISKVGFTPQTRTVDVEAAGGGVLQVSAPVILDHAALLALDSAPPELVPAQGAGTIIAPIQVIAELSYGGSAEGAFTGGSTPVFGYPSQALGSLPSALLGQTADVVAFAAVGVADVIPAAAAVNQPLILTDPVPYADGDPDTTLRLTTLYYVRGA